MVEHLLIVVMATVLAQQERWGWTRLWLAAVAVIYGVGLAEDILIALPGFVARHYHG